jgi:RNA polymerase-interacting CarD/CdnL/TRCF family regulator
MTGSNPQTWDVGDTVFCPARGLGTVTDRGTRSPLGTPREYLTIEVARNRMTIMVPLDEVEAIGLRKPASRPALRNALEVLSQPRGEESDAWQARSKVNERKLHDGALLDTAEVVRDLSWRAAEKPLGVRDRQMLATGRERIEGQLAHAFKIDETSAHVMVSDPLPVPYGETA